MATSRPRPLPGPGTRRGSIKRPTQREIPEHALELIEDLGPGFLPVVAPDRRIPATEPQVIGETLERGAGTLIQFLDESCR